MLHHERLELLQELEQAKGSGASTDNFSTHRIHEIKVQLLRLLYRHKLLRNAVLLENTAIAFFVTNAMCKLFSYQLVELETRSLPLLVEPNTQGMHQDRPQEAIAQMPVASFAWIPDSRVEKLQKCL
jgi:hypothetical protein